MDDKSTYPKYEREITLKFGVYYYIFNPIFIKVSSKKI